LEAGYVHAYSGAGGNTRELPMLVHGWTRVQTDEGRATGDEGLVTSFDDYRNIIVRSSDSAVFVNRVFSNSFRRSADQMNGPSPERLWLS